MNHDKQRIAIAEACGYVNVCEENWESVDIETRTIAYGVEVQGTLNGKRKFVPDYLNDLNAMHEAEQVCIINKRETRYSAFLHDEIPCGTPAWYATAAQRAEAFLRTIGKWEDA